MKQLLFLLAILFSLMSCKKSHDRPFATERKPDTVQNEFVPGLQYTLAIQNAAEKQIKLDSLQRRSDSLALVNDSLVRKNKYFANELMNKKLQIQNAKFYLNIANKKPSQRKFLLGWMNRALNE